MQMIDLTGKRFGFLQVVERDGVDKWGQVQWRCLCDCGNEKTVVAGSLKKGLTKSCGCFRKAEGVKRGKASATHGMKGTPEFRSWMAMRRRCRDKTRPDADFYALAGIVVCDRWDNSFKAFYQDMGPMPSPDHSIDRIDGNGNYEPSNCRWADKHIQAINKRMSSRNTTGITGVEKTKHGKWTARISDKEKGNIHLGTFDDFFEACCARKSAEVKYGYLEARRGT